MAVVHVKSTGTKSSGQSTIGDWTDANCYPYSSWATAVGALATGDTLIADDETVVIGTTLSLNNALTTSTLTIQSRSGGTVWQLGSASTTILNFADTTDTTTLVIEDITFDGSTFAWTTTSGAPTSFTQLCPSLTFNRCTWRNFSTNTAARTTGFLMRYAASTAASTLAMNDCVVENITAQCSGDFQGMFKVEDNDLTWTIDGLTFDNISVTTTGAGNNLGLVYQTNTTALTMRDIVLSDITMVGPAGQSVAGLYRAQGTPGTLTLDGLTVTNMVMNGLAATEGILKVIGAATISNVDVTELRRTGTAPGGGNSIGGVVSVQGASGAATVTDMIVRDSGGFYGTAFYNSGGSTIVARRVRAINIDDGGQVDNSGNPVNGNAFYSGGDGNATWDSCYAYNVTGSAVNGVAWYAHLADTGAASKTFTMRNCSFVGCTSSATQMSGRIMALLPAQVFTVNIYNTLFDNGVYEFETVQTTGTLTVTGQRLHITEGVGAVTVTSGTVNLNSPTSGDPEITVREVDDAYWVASTSPLIRGGMCPLSTGCTPHDMHNRRVRVPPDIGAVQRIASDP